MSTSGELRPFEVPETFREYVYRLIELGIVEGPLGKMAYTPEIVRLVDALHHVMAGGKVAVQLEEEGDGRVVADLDQRFESFREFLAGQAPTGGEERS